MSPSSSMTASPWPSRRGAGPRGSARCRWWPSGRAAHVPALEPTSQWEREMSPLGLRTWIIRGITLPWTRWACGWRPMITGRSSSSTSPVDIRIRPRGRPPHLLGLLAQRTPAEGAGGTGRRVGVAVRALAGQHHRSGAGAGAGAAAAGAAGTSAGRCASASARRGRPRRARPAGRPGPGPRLAEATGCGSGAADAAVPAAAERVSQGTASIRSAGWAGFPALRPARTSGATAVLPGLRQRTAAVVLGADWPVARRYGQPSGPARRRPPRRPVRLAGPAGCPSAEAGSASAAAPSDSSSGT